MAHKIEPPYIVYVVLKKVTGAKTAISVFDSMYEAEEYVVGHPQEKRLLVRKYILMRGE